MSNLELISQRVFNEFCWINSQEDTNYNQEMALNINSYNDICWFNYLVFILIILQMTIASDIISN